MKIQDITVFTYMVEYAHGTYVMSGGRKATGYKSFVIRIRTDTGVEGWAENAPLGSDHVPSSYTGELAALEELCPQVLGLDPREPGAIINKLDRAMRLGTVAKSIIDMACWDILGKSVALPTHVLLGGLVNPDPPAYNVVSHGAGGVEDSVKLAMSEVERGMRALQIKVGGDPLMDAARTRAIYDSVPKHVYLFADANGAWTRAQALKYARALGQEMTVALEEPCRLLADNGAIAQLTALPVIVDECILTIADLVEAHRLGCTGVNLKISRVGGLTRARQMRDVAVALGMSLTADDTWGCALTTVQNLALATSTPADRLTAIDCYAEWTKPMIADCPLMGANGRVLPTTTPGNGYGKIKLEILGKPLLSFSL